MAAVLQFEKQPQAQTSAVVDGRHIAIGVNPGEDWIGGAYFRLKSEGIFPIFMHNNPTIGLSAFLAWAAKITTLGFFSNPDTIPTLDGFAFINRIQQFGEESICEVGEMFFRGTPRNVTLAYCRMALDFCFITRGFVAVYGITPEANRPARIFNRRLGFTCSEPLPGLVGWGGKAANGIISSMSREQWLSLRETL
jgi:hypothetical protein